MIRPTIFSGFTEALLEALDDGFASGALGAPAWSSERPHRLTRGSELAIELARKVGIEEGATLVFERKRPGDRALVFTNVEPRAGPRRDIWERRACSRCSARRCDDVMRLRDGAPG